jgi:hypothetical protein
VLAAIQKAEGPLGFNRLKLMTGGIDDESFALGRMAQLISRGKVSASLQAL